MDAHNVELDNMSVYDFVNQASRLLQDDEQVDFVQFVLTGKYGNKQAVVDAVLNSLPNDEDLGATRDYDSLLGIDKDIRLKGALTVYPVSRKEDVLSHNIHIHHDFTNSKAPPVHKVPNLCLGKWGVHNILRVLIPDLYHQNRSQFLSQEEQKIFYEAGLRPAIEELEIERVNEWPATYGDEMFRARGTNGQLCFQTKVIPYWLVPDLGDSIRSNLQENGYSWGEGLVFLHQIRGVKHANTHSVGRVAARQALTNFLEQNQLDISLNHATQSWWVDVGLEVDSKENNCLAWRTDSHYYIVQTILNIPQHHADRITTVGSSKYTRDMASHLTAVSGCRIAPGYMGRGSFRVPYFQMYTTDKSLTYRHDRGHYGKFITCTNVLKGKAQEFIDNLYRLYRNASRNTRSLARVEARCLLVDADKIFLNIHENQLERLLRDSLVSFPPQEWWGLRGYRALAIKLVLQWQAEGEAVHRAKMPALLLTAGSVWLLNGLHSAPDKGASSKQLMAAIFPHVDRIGADRDILAYGTPTKDNDVDSEASGSDDDLPPHARGRSGATTLPAFPYGLVFLRNIRVGPQYPVPRLNNEGQSMDPNPFQYFFGVNFNQIEQEFFRTPLVHPEHPTRISNKVRRTAIYYPPDEDGGNIKDFNLAMHGYRLPSPTRDAGSDVSIHEDSDQDSNQEDNDEGNDIDTSLTQLWRQFLLDITAKAPNKKNASDPSYCLLTSDERRRVNDETYQDRKLSNYFRDCQWKIANNSEWDLIFNRLFPPKNGRVLAGKVQNYAATRYYPKWADLKERVDDETARRMQQALKIKFDDLYWMPFAQTDRIWKTKVDLKFKKSSGVDARIAAPQILVKDIRPLW